MQRGTRILVTLAALGLAGCGANTTDRALSGGLIGTAGAVVVGAPVLGVALVGAGVGALTDRDQIDLGRPIWK